MKSPRELSFFYLAGVLGQVQKNLSSWFIFCELGKIQ